MFVGGWYFQSSIDELRTLVDHQQDTIVELKKEIAEQTYETLGQTSKTTQQEGTAQQLKVKLLDDSKNFYFKKGIGIKSENVCKQVRDQKSMEQVKDGA